MVGGQPPARFAFRQRETLMDMIGIGNQSVDLQNVLRNVGIASPTGRVIDRICYSGQLMKNSAAQNMLKGLKKYADKNEISYADASIFDPRVALIQFNSEVVGLGPALAVAVGGKLNADVDHVSDLATLAGTTAEVVVCAAQGKCIHIPRELADRIAIAAVQVLRLSEPLKVVQCMPNERAKKPIGGSGLEKGQQPHQCSETQRVRRAVLATLVAVTDKAA